MEASLAAGPRRAWLAAAGSGCGWGCAVGAVVASIDALDTLHSGFDGSWLALLAYVFSSLMFAFGVLGALLGAWTALVVGGLGKATRGWLRALRALLLSLPACAFVAWVPTSWITEHWASLSGKSAAVAVLVYPIAVLGSTLVAYVVYAVVERYSASPRSLPRFHHPLLLTVLLLGAASYWADRRVLVDLYDDFHYGLAGLFVSCCAASLMLIARIPKVRHLSRLDALEHHGVLLRRVTLGVSLAALVLLEVLEPDVFGPSRSVIFGKLTGTVRAWSDFDRDGPSNLFGGSDCAPFDPEVRPGKFDLPGDALDDDCSGTAAQWPKAAAKASYPVPDASGFNVLLITIDALRADHVGAWGYRRHPTTPNLDRLAAQSLRFARAISPSPKTYDVLPCLLTGLYPSNIPRDYRVKLAPGKKKRPYIYRITKEADILTETLQRAGYVTAAGHGVGLLALLGLDRGFDDYMVTSEQTDFAIDFLQRRVVDATEKKPFFLWLHYYSPHYPYDPHEEFAFGDEEIDLYDGEIAYDDHRIGTLLTRLDELGLTDQTVIVATADHGEEFRDHGGTEHGFKLYSELTHVPLLVKIPGVRPAVVDDIVELADVAPTLCELLRLGEACPEHDGHSLFEALAGRRDRDRGAYSEMYRKGDVLLMNSLYTPQWRMIYDYKKDRAELYDIKTDPGEHHNVASRHPKLVQAFRDRLATRTLYRQGQVFERYRASGDSLDLAKGLSTFRRKELLRVVLKLMERDVGRQHSPYLKELLTRPGLDSNSKSRARALLERARGPASQKSD